MVINFKKISSNVVEKNKEKGVKKMNKSKKINLREEEKAILYFTINSKDNSIQYEKELLMLNYANKHNLSVIKTWKVVETAWNDPNKKSFSEMLEFVKEHHEIRHIIFDTWNMERNDTEKSKIKDLIKNYNKIIHFTNINQIYNKYSSPDEKFMIDIDVAVAKKMSNMISTKTILGMKQKVEKGVYPGKPPIGYINNRETKTIDIDNKTAPTIRFLFERVATEKISTFSDLKKIAIQEEIEIDKLYSILTNPFYCGFFRWKGNLHTGIHIPLVSQETWLKIYKKIKKEVRKIEHN